MDLESLHLIYNQLNRLKENLVKLGPRRREGQILNKKHLETQTLYEQSQEILLILYKKYEKKECPEEVIQFAKVIKNKINRIYQEILVLCKVKEQIEEEGREGQVSEQETEEEEQSSSRESESDSDIEMAGKDNFELKTAVSLLPVMDSTEATTLRLIDAIDLYDSMLKEEGKQSLINFILKTRLSQSAKLRMSSTYTSVATLLVDMRQHLVTKKSDVALQSKLQATVQGSRSIQDFGSEIEQIFVNLTISQADGNMERYNVLREINERNAINRFAHGLSSQKLSTIISARNFSSLKDAIRAAQDEAVSSNANQQMFTFHNRGSRGARGRFMNHRGYRGLANSSNYSNNSYHNNHRAYDNNSYHNNQGRSRGRNNFYRGGRDNYRSNRGAVHYLSGAEGTDPKAGSSSNTNDEETVKFFRE